MIPSAISQIAGPVADKGHAARSKPNRSSVRDSRSPCTEPH